MARLFAFFIRRAKADDCLAAQERGFIADRLCFFDGSGDGVRVVTIHVANDMPAVGFEAHWRVVGKPAFHLAVDGDAVVVVHRDEFSKSQRASERRGLVRDAFHKAAITQKT